MLAFEGRIINAETHQPIPMFTVRVAYENDDFKYPQTVETNNGAYTLQLHDEALEGFVYVHGRSGVDEMLGSALEGDVLKLEIHATGYDGEILSLPKEALNTQEPNGLDIELTPAPSYNIEADMGE